MCVCACLGFVCSRFSCSLFPILFDVRVGSRLLFVHGLVYVLFVLDMYLFVCICVFGLCSYLSSVDRVFCSYFNVCLCFCLLAVSNCCLVFVVWCLLFGFLFVFPIDYSCV